MNKQKKALSTIDEYITQFPESIRAKLSEIRKAVQETAPKAQEKLSYQMPAFFLNGVLVYYAAFKDHLSFFPTASGVAAFKKDLAKYAVTKGTIHFPLDEKLPIALIKKIVKFRVEENMAKKRKSGKDGRLQNGVIVL